MASKGPFENQFDDYSNNSVPNFLSNSGDAISEKFQSKLQNFKINKLQHINTKYKYEIFYDGTIYTGSTGLALYYFLCSLKNDNNHELLLKALEFLDLNNLKRRRISFLCGDAGPLALGTVISYKLGTKRNESILPDYKVLAQRLMSLISLLNDSPDELLYGKSGYLYALLFVNKNVSGKEIIPGSHIEKVIRSILQSGKQFSLQMKSKSPLLWNWHDKIYFGAAHGMAGILFMLLQACLYINIIEIRNFVKPALDWLLNQQLPSGNFPSSMSSTSGDKLVQWCHGAPGFVPLCILAAQIFEEDKYIRIAVKCGDVVWARGLCSKGYSLCHGVSGNAYTFLQLYQATKKVIYLYRACCFMEWCAMERPGTELHHPDRPASLFEGLVGRLYLAEDLSRVLDSKFPGFVI